MRQDLRREALRDVLVCDDLADGFGVKEERGA